MTKSTTEQPNQNPTPQTNNRFLTAYGPKRKVSITFEGVGKTQQQFKDECDINTIMARYQQTGLIESFNQKQPRYIDCSGADYQEAMQVVAAANSMFQDLPSQIRNRFDNDPAQFLEFAQNPENLPEMAEMGLARPDYQKQGGTSQPAATSQPTPPSATPQPQNPPSIPQPAQS